MRKECGKIADLAEAEDRQELPQFPAIGLGAVPSGMRKRRDVSSQPERAPRECIGYPSRSNGNQPSLRLQPKPQAGLEGRGGAARGVV
jgi:hypothetical protein